MSKTYVTFGQIHIHAFTVKGERKIFDKDCVAVIDGKDEQQGRAKAWELFDAKFCTTYYGDQWKEEDQLRYFPRGYINVN
jgi:hypothetical protein